MLAEQEPGKFYKSVSAFLLHVLARPSQPEHYLSYVRSREGTPQRAIDKCEKCSTESKHALARSWQHLLERNHPGVQITALRAWQEAGRAGRPRLVGGMYYALGPDAAEKARPYLHQFYAFAGEMAEVISRRLADTPQKVRDALSAYRDIGVDELILWPCIADLDQIERLAQLTH